MVVWTSTFVDEHKHGRVFHAPYEVLLSGTDVVQPDLLFISNQREEVITHANVQGAPDLIVEIMLPSSSPPTTWCRS